MESTVCWLGKFWCVCARILVCMCVDIIRKEWTFCMFCMCQEQTSEQERTNAMSVVGFDFSFGLVIFENPGISPKIIGVACFRSWHWNYFWNHLYINKRLLLVKTSHISVRSSHVKCWPFKYWWSTLSSKTYKKIGSAFGVEVTYRCVSACVCISWQHA